MDIKNIKAFPHAYEHNCKVRVALPKILEDLVKSSTTAVDEINESQTTETGRVIYLNMPKNIYWVYKYYIVK